MTTMSSMANTIANSILKTLYWWLLRSTVEVEMNTGWTFLWSLIAEYTDCIDSGITMCWS